MSRLKRNFYFISKNIFVVNVTNIYKIMAVLKVETNIILSIVRSCFDVILTDNFQFIDADNITRWVQRKNVQITDNMMYSDFEPLTDLIFLWIKVSSVIQILWVPHIKGKMSNLPIIWFIVIVCHWLILTKLFVKIYSKYSGTCLIWHTKGPGKCVGLYRMSEYSGFI